MNDERPQQVLEIVDRIRPLLAGHSPDIQGAVLADLLSIWLAGHQGPAGLINKYRADILTELFATALRLVPANEKELLARFPLKHALVGDTLTTEEEGIIGRCLCGWTTGHRFSSFAASAAFRDHLEQVGADG